MIIQSVIVDNVVNFIVLNILLLLLMCLYFLSESIEEHPNFIHTIFYFIQFVLKAGNIQTGNNLDVVTYNCQVG